MDLVQVCTYQKAAPIWLPYTPNTRLVSQPTTILHGLRRFGRCTYALAGLQVDLLSSKRMLAQAEQVGSSGVGLQDASEWGVTHDLTHVG